MALIPTNWTTKPIMVSEVPIIIRTDSLCLRNILDTMMDGSSSGLMIAVAGNVLSATILDG
jgi:hypothetical protein